MSCRQSRSASRLEQRHQRRQESNASGTGAAFQHELPLEVDRIYIGADGRAGPAVNRQNIALDQRLRADAAGSGITLNPFGSVSRRHYAEQMGMHQTHLCKVCAETLEAWDAHVLAAHGGLTPIARAFVDMVERDRKGPTGVVLSIGVQKGPPIGAQKGPPSPSSMSGMTVAAFALVAT